MMVDFARPLTALVLNGVTYEVTAALISRDDDSFLRADMTLAAALPADAVGCDAVLHMGRGGDYQVVILDAGRDGRSVSAGVLLEG